MNKMSEFETETEKISTAMAYSKVLEVLSELDLNLSF